MVLILVLLTVAACIAIRYGLERGAAREKARVAADSARVPWIPPRLAFRMPPAGYLFHEGHTWARMEATGDARVGLDDFAQGVIGRIDRIEMPPPGTTVRQGEKAFTVVQDRKRIDFPSPLDGIVRGVNGTLSPDAAVVKADPYRAGWILALEPGHLARNLRRLKVAEEAGAWIEKETRRLADFLALHAATPSDVGVTMTDGGLPAAGIVEWADGELFHNLVRKFFR